MNEKCPRVFCNFCFGALKRVYSNPIHEVLIVLLARKENKGLRVIKIVMLKWMCRVFSLSRLQEISVLCSECIPLGGGKGIRWIRYSLPPARRASVRREPNRMMRPSSLPHVHTSVGRKGSYLLPGSKLSVLYNLEGENIIPPIVFSSSWSQIIFCFLTSSIVLFLYRT
jgi:hypothetical protein